VKRQQAGIADDAFLAKLNQLIEKYPADIGKQERGEKERPRSIHLIVAEENIHSNEASEAFEYENITHRDLDFVAKTANHHFERSTYAVLVNDTASNLRPPKFDPEKRMQLKLKGGELLGRAAAADSSISDQKRSELMAGILAAAAEEGDYEPSEVQTIRSETFAQLPRFSHSDPLELIRNTFRPILAHILYENELYKEELNLADIPTWRQSQIKKLHQDKQVKAPPAVRELMDKLVNGETVQTDKKFFAYLASLICYQA
ncbi:MAG: hypothetical protein OXU45_07825, partial [Candidatus Melainabacteria bacterium]|nr:hypothetical protein [Candidatus Melainabacteria bacterium]